MNQDTMETCLQVEHPLNLDREMGYFRKRNDGKIFRKYRKDKHFCNHVHEKIVQQSVSSWDFLIMKETMSRIWTLIDEK